MSVSDIIRHNFWWKAAAMILATLIWFTIDKGEHTLPLPKVPGNVEREYRAVPVRWLVLSGKAIPGKLIPDKVTVVATGSESAFDRVRADELVAFVRVGGGGQQAGMQPVEVRAPAGIVVESIQPSHVNVEMQPETGKPPPPSK